ncbi:MAG: hypothetical protein RBT49_00905 [Bacteroidales bacterium]|jgi:hypothetical protein|nr:hypothetical protein [Bacteroidales bacterium]
MKKKVKLKKTQVNDFVKDIKKKFIISDFRTINEILNSSFSPINCKKKFNRISINQEVNFVEDLILEHNDLLLKDYNLKFSVFVTLFKEVIDQISKTLISEFRSGDIYQIIHQQEFEIKKASYKIQYDVNNLILLFNLNNNKTPYFTDGMIYENLYRFLESYYYLFENLRQENFYLENSYWEDKTVLTFYEIINKQPILKHFLHPKPSNYFGIFFDDKYLNTIKKYKINNGNKDLVHEEIYAIIREHKDNDEEFSSYFDFNLSKIELIVLIKFLYDYNVVTPNLNKTIKLHDYFYKKQYDSIEIIKDREITFFIENFCSINGKRVIGVKKLLNELNSYELNDKPPILKLIKKLKQFENYNNYNGFLMIPGKRQNDCFSFQEQEVKKPILFNFIITKRRVICLCLSIINNPAIINFRETDILNLYQLLDNHSIFSKDNSYVIESYFADLTFNLFNYKRFYKRIICAFEKKMTK